MTEQRGSDAGVVGQGFEILTVPECLELLASRSFGRVGVCVDALPAVFPVTYAMREDDIYFWTATGTKLSAATRRAVVAFQIDEIDPLDHSGWSVLVVGHARALSLDRASELSWLPARPWVPGDRHEMVQIPTEVISGRRIRHDHPQVHS